MKESKRFGGRARAAVLALVAAVIAIAPVGVARPGAAQDGASPEVVIHHNQFAPAALTVHAGTTVTWVNRDDDTHTVTSKANAFGSGGLDPAEVYRFTFTKPGTYTYYCAIHPTMTATVVVQ
jgi:plastocyanin